MSNASLTLSFKRLPQAEIIPCTSNVLMRMIADPQFVSLKPQVDALQTAYDAFTVAYSAAANGGKDRTLEKNARREALIQQLVVVALSVEILAKGSEEIIIAAGFETRRPAKPVYELSTPVGLSVVNAERTGSVRLAWQPVNGAVNYAIEHLVDGETVWQNGKYSTTCRDVVLTGYKPGELVNFRIRALGRKSMESDWCSSASIWVS